MTLQFHANAEPTVGVEFELQLLDAETLDLADGILPLLKLYPQARHVKPEFIQYTVEVCSPPCRNATELQRELTAILRELKARAATLGLVLCGAGTHPFSTRLAPVTPLPRYQRLERQAGLLGHSIITYATHVHVGMPSGDDALRVMRHLKPCLPVFLALAANSPFWHGCETGYSCYRQRLLAAARSYGIPPYFDDWRAFSEFFAAAQRAGVFERIKDIHWDIRPQPNFGTLELRVMDAQPTVRAVVALAALVQALAVHFLKADGPDPRVPQPLPWWFEKDNHFRASRAGLEASVVFDATGGTRPLQQVAADLIAVARPAAEALGTASELADCRSLLAAPVCERQRQVLADNGTLRDVAAALVRELAEELAPAQPADAPRA